MLAYFFSGLVLSFIGSMPFGMINMAVAYMALQKGIRAGIWMGVGAALVELFQVFIALKFTWFFEEEGMLGFIFQIIAMAVFFIVGIYFFFFAKTAPPKTENKSESNRSGPFIKGAFISSLNLVVFPYWIFYGTLLTSKGWLVREDWCVLIFSIGAAIGAFALLVAYAFLGDRLLRKSEQVTRWVNKFIGTILIAFGVYQMVEWLNG